MYKLGYLEVIKGDSKGGRGERSKEIGDGGIRSKRRCVLAGSERDNSRIPPLWPLSIRVMADALICAVECRGTDASHGIVV